jgi:hypothetical protein
MKNRSLVVLFLLALGWSPVVWSGCFPIPIPPFFACVLDREGTLTPKPPDYYTCHENFDLEKAGGKPFFKIELNGFCGVHPGDGLPGWTPVPWKSVTVLAEYNYDTGVAKEVIWQANNIMLSSELTCGSNPWAHTPSCTPNRPLTNNTGVEYNGSVPVSAYRIDYSLRQALAKWENTPSNEEALKDWNPYAGTAIGGLDITSPGSYEVVPENAASFQLAVAKGSEDSTPQNLEIQWQKIIPAPEVVGDIALPATATHWWEPFFGPTYVQWSGLPLTVTVNPGYFENKPGLYEVRVRNAAGGSWSAPERFWIGNPTFEPPPEPAQNLKAAIAKQKQLKASSANLPQGSRQRLRAAVAPGPRLRVVKITWDETRGRPGHPLSLRVTVKNVGAKASPPNRYRLHVACAPAGDCPRTGSASLGAALKPGQSRTITIRNAVAPKSSNTRFFVSTEPINLAPRFRVRRIR